MCPSKDGETSNNGKVNFKKHQYMHSTCNLFYTHEPFLVDHALPYLLPAPSLACSVQPKKLVSNVITLSPKTCIIHIFLSALDCHISCAIWTSLKDMTPKMSSLVLSCVVLYLSLSSRCIFLHYRFLYL